MKVSAKGRALVWVVFLFGGAYVSIYADSVLFPDLFSDLTFHVISFVIGIILLRAVFKASKNTGRTLAKYGRKGDIPRLETNVLVTKGVYGKMRHPMHLGLFLFPLGVAFLLGSPTFILIVAPLEIIIMILLVKFVEEKEALEKFGDDYLEYKKHTPAFCFRADCLRALFGKKDSDIH